MLNYINGDLIGRTNLTNFRASERRAELGRAFCRTPLLPSAAENIELVKIRATDQVAINIIEHVSCKFVKFVGKKSEIRGQKI